MSDPRMIEAVVLAAVTSETEEWRDVPSVPTIEASSEGRVRNRTGHSPSRSGKPQTGRWDEKQRRFVFRNKAGCFRVARLVCEAFHGPPPADNPYCLHNDENSRNNRPANLKWGTQKENLSAPGFAAYRKAKGYERAADRRKQARGYIVVRKKTGVRYVVQIKRHKKMIYVGTYFTPEAANEAYHRCWDAQS